MIDLMFPFLVLILFQTLVPSLFISTKKDIEKLVTGITILTVISSDLVFLYKFKTTLGCKLMSLRIVQSSGEDPKIKDYFYWKLYLLIECVGVVPFLRETFYFLKNGRTKRDEIFNLYVIDKIKFSSIDSLENTNMGNEFKDAA